MFLQFSRVALRELQRMTQQSDATTTATALQQQTQALMEVVERVKELEEEVGSLERAYRDGSDQVALEKSEDVRRPPTIVLLARRLHVLTHEAIRGRRDRMRSRVCWPNSSKRISIRHARRSGIWKWRGLSPIRWCRFANASSPSTAVL